MAYTDLTANSLLTPIMPRIRSGILISNIAVPVGNPVMTLRIMAIPLAPPGAIPEGSRKTAIATENTAHPTAIISQS